MRATWIPYHIGHGVIGFVAQGPHRMLGSLMDSYYFILLNLSDLLDLQLPIYNDCGISM